MQIISLRPVHLCVSIEKKKMETLKWPRHSPPVITKEGSKTCLHIAPESACQVDRGGKPTKSCHFIFTNPLPEKNEA